MAAEIRQARIDSLSDDKISETIRDTEKTEMKDRIQSYVADLEGEGYEAEKQRLTENAEAVELTPVEAFTRNVEGDQSPCKC